jgi:hypothetical protein
MIGWVKLHRKLLVSDMYQDLNAVQRDVLLQCLLAANHKPKKWEWQGKIFECKAGQFITSLDSLIKLCSKGTSVRNIRTALVKLEKWQFLTNESTKTGRLITVINWDTYQNCDEETDKAIDKEATKSRQTSDKQPTTNKNEKNEKNEKKKPLWILPEGIKPEVWEEFEAHRKTTKVKLTDDARTKNANILLKNLGEQQEIIDSTIANGWTGLFPLKKGKVFKSRSEKNAEAAEAFLSSATTEKDITPTLEAIE